MSNITHTPFDREDLARRVLDALCHPSLSCEEHLIDQARMIANLGELLQDYADATADGPIQAHAPLIESFGRSVRQHALVVRCLAETLAGTHETINREPAAIVAPVAPGKSSVRAAS